MPFKLPYTSNGKFLVSCLLASAVSYQITAKYSRDCQAAWMVSEEKKSHLPSTNSETVNNWVGDFRSVTMLQIPRSCPLHYSSFKSLISLSYTSTPSYSHSSLFKRCISVSPSSHCSNNHSLHAFSRPICCRQLATSSIHESKKLFGRRSFPDHRGKITAGNRPEDEFIASKESEESILDDADYAAFVHGAAGPQAGVVGQVGLEGKVFVVLPWIKWGPMKKTVTTDTLLLNEACALVKSLPNTDIVGKVRLCFSSSS